MVVALVVASYFGGWWIFADSVNREGQIRRTSFEYQQGRVDQSLHNIIEIRTMNSQINISDGTQSSLLKSQRTALINDTCKIASEIDEGNRPTEIKRFYSEECV